MPLVVAVGGGSGGLGRRIVDALKADNRYEPLILARKVRGDFLILPDLDSNHISFR